MSVTKHLTAVTLAGLITVVSGCSNDSNPVSPDFDDGSPSSPITEQVENSLPEPMGLSKGNAGKPIEHSLNIAAGKLDINEKLRLKNILAGYFSFDEYLLEGQIRQGGYVNKLYATNGHYDATLNKFIIKAEDLIDSPKKSFVI